MIELNDPNEATPRYPVITPRQIGNEFYGMLIKNPERRDRQKKNDQTGQMEPIPNGRGGTKKELVVTLMVLPGTTMPAGTVTEPVVVQPGDIVRRILKGKAYGNWIDAEKAHGKLHVGDVYGEVCNVAQAYDGNGSPTGPQLTTVEQANGVPRGVTVGHYTDLGLRSATPDEAQWVAKAEAAHFADKPTIELDSGLGGAPAGADVPGVFGQPAPAAAQAPASGFPGWPAAS